MTDTQQMVANAVTPNTETASGKTPQEVYAAWAEERERRFEREQDLPRIREVRRLAKTFLLGLEAKGAHGYAIVAVPNELVRGSTLAAREGCEDCEADCSCEECDEALCEDERHDHLYILQTGVADDYSGLAYELYGEGNERVCDLLCDAESVSAKIAEVEALPPSTGVIYTPEYWERARALINSPQMCETCKKYLSLRAKPVVNVRLVMTGTGKPSPERLHLLCTKCFPDPVEEVAEAA